MPTMIGSTLNQYEVEEVLGRGGMGVVYRARDTRLNRPVALKVLSAELTAEEDRRRRFLQEARTAGAINHPAVAQIYDVDEADGVTFIAMEFVEGKTIRELVMGRELDILGAVEIGIQAGEGLAKAHEMGIVHRDIKADNIMVTRDGHAKILDFGLAKLLDPAVGSAGESGSQGRASLMETIARTQDGVVLGTVAYMSPEQARGQKVDHRSDIFSLGIVLYEMVTGQLPFTGDSPLDTMHAIAFEETRPVTTLRANLPPSLQRVASRCLRKRPEDRYDSARALVQDLKGVQQEIESGISVKTPLAERFREGLRSLREMAPAEWVWPVLGASALVVMLILAFSGWDTQFWTLVFLGFVGLLIYRRIRNRRYRLIKRFTAKVRKMSEVRLIVFQGNESTVVVDRAMAKTYVRINALMDKVNSKRFFGDPFTVAVRDGVSVEEVRSLLAGPGVSYVRDDVLDGGG
jgi:tRNA A-37 threonylcarbamoyl transferase component Bud32